MSKEEQKRSNKDRYMERLKSKYPDKEYADDEAVYGQAMDDYDAYEKDIEGYKKNQQVMSDLLVNNPEMGSVFANMMPDEKGKKHNVIGAMIKRYGPTFKEALDDPAKLEEIVEADNEFAAMAKEEEDLKRQSKENWEKSLDMMDQLNDEGWTDEEIATAMGMLIDMSNRHILKNFTKEDLVMARNAMNHDQDVADADKEGELRGKNTRVQEELKKKKKNGDGVPAMRGSGGGAGRPGRDLGALGRMTDHGSIWDK